jgi:hypothetical protein
MSEHRTQALWVGVAAILGLLITWSGLNDWRPFNSPTSENPAVASSQSAGSIPGLGAATSVATSPGSNLPPATTPGTEAPVDNHPVVWQGSIRVTRDGINLGTAPPSTGGVYSTIIYMPDELAFETNYSFDVARWDNDGEATFDLCASQIGTNKLSSSEANHIPYKQGLALCVKTFGADRLAFIRITGASGGEGVTAVAKVWDATGA